MHWCPFVVSHRQLRLVKYISLTTPQDESHVMLVHSAFCHTWKVHVPRSKFDTWCHYVTMSWFTAIGNILSYFVVNMVDSGSSNGLSFRHQAITWTNAELLLIRPSRTIINQYLFAILMFSSKKMHLKMGPCITRTSAATVLNMQDYKKIENKANLRDLIAATGLVISNWIQIVNFYCPCDREIWWMTLNKANLRDLKAATGL